MTNHARPAGRPLEGMRVLDLSRALAGPYCAQVLGDLGAEVIKVEQPGRPDQAREWPPLHAGVSAYFAVANRNKLSMTLDLKAPAGRDVLAALVRGADVVVENFRPGVAETLGVGYEQLRTLNERIVLVTIQGYGPGRREFEPAYDAAIQAYSGMMSVTGEADGDVARIGVAVVDFSTALYAAVGAISAYHAAREDGNGRHIEVSLLGSSLATMSFHLTAFMMANELILRSGSSHPAMAPTRVYHTATGDLLVVVADDAQWIGLCRALERPDLESDERFATNPDRVQRQSELHVAIQEEMRKRTREEWERILVEHRVAHAPVRNADEVVADPDVSARHVADASLANGATWSFITSPIHVDGQALPVHSPPPEVGQDTEAILKELGLDGSSIEGLREDRVI